MKITDGARFLLAHRIWWQLLILILVSLVAVCVNVTFDQRASNYFPEYSVNPSSYNYKASGYSGLLELCRRLNFKIRLWESPYRLLSGTHRTLVIISPEQALEPWQVKQVLDWVKTGNNLVYFDDFSYAFERQLLQELGVEIIDGKPLKNFKIRPNSNLPIFDHVMHLMISADQRLLHGSPVVEDNSGSLMSLVKFGQGEILLGTTPDIWSNQRLFDSASWGNFQFMYNWFASRGGEILLDEFSHDHMGGTNVFIFLGRGPAGLIALQLLLLLLIAVASSWQRFGRTSVFNPKRSISSSEFITGMANTYQRAAATTLSFEILHHALKSQLGKALGVSAQEPVEVWSQAWSKLTKQPAQEFQSYLQSAGQALQNPKLPEQEFLELVNRCDKISEQLRTRHVNLKEKSIHGTDG